MNRKGKWENQYGSVIEITGAGNRQVAGRLETLWYMLSEKEEEKTSWWGAMRTNADTFRKL
ncbi:MAG: hypothetical protein INR69_13715 [Mucilaginibacter polytrichastri]|nr:hypothetical protein [Mucilaginibacter polytrichastri]